ncbi:FtsW/RodA/SpoVE family cell cycle protein [Enterococcus termitis]
MCCSKKTGTFLLLSLPTDWLPQKFGYLVTRFEVMQNPFIDPTGKGFQTSNAYYAMHNGGFWGLGLGNSIQKKASCLRRIPISFLQSASRSLG